MSHQKRTTLKTNTMTATAIVCRNSYYTRRIRHIHGIPSVQIIIRGRILKNKKQKTKNKKQKTKWETICFYSCGTLGNHVS